MTIPKPRNLLTLLSGISWIALPFFVFFLLSDRQEALLRTEAWPQLEREVRRTAEITALETMEGLLEDVREVAISEARRQVWLADGADPPSIPVGPPARRRLPDSTYLGSLRRLAARPWATETRVP